MHDVSPAATTLASKLLHQEADGELDAVELAAEAHQICLRLEDRLSTLFGRPGYNALLGRAVHLAQRDFQILHPLAVDRGTQGGVSGFNEFGVANSDDPEAVAAALVAVFANLIWLLVVFIGVELSIRLIGELWPELAEAAGVLSEQEGEPHS